MAEIQKAYKSEKELRGLDAAEIGARVLRGVLEGSEGTFDLEKPEREVIMLLGVNG